MLNPTGFTRVLGAENPRRPSSGLNRKLSSALPIWGGSRWLRKVGPYLEHEFATEFLDVGRKHDIEKPQRNTGWPTVALRRTGIHMLAKWTKPSLVFKHGPLYASLDRRDAHHLACRRLIESASEPLVIPAPVLVEVDYWIGKWLHSGVMLAVLDDIANGVFRVEDLLPEDLPGGSASSAHDMPTPTSASSTPPSSRSSNGLASRNWRRSTTGTSACSDHGTWTPFTSSPNRAHGVHGRLNSERHGHAPAAAQTVRTVRLFDSWHFSHGGLPSSFR